jgi:hypothetical protein
MTVTVGNALTIGSSPHLHVVFGSWRGTLRSKMIQTLLFRGERS